MERGHEAYSCDILPTEGNPEWHIQDDILNHLDDGWDLGIFHPPCTHLAVAGASYWKKKQQDGTQEEAMLFFRSLYNANIPKIAVENPVGIMSTIFRKPNQYIEPFQFGEPFKKKTGLWLRNLPSLKPTNIIEPRCYWAQPHGSAYKKKSMRLSSIGGHRSSKERSRTFQGIANAMAEQWGN